MTCVICEKIKEKKAIIVYEDDTLIAVLPSKPAAIGHIKIMPKQHFTKLEELDDELVQDLFFLANYSSASVFEALQAHGTNIIMNESDNHLAIDIIPRKENDGLNFTWKPQQLSPEEMDAVHSKLKDSAFIIGKTEQEPMPVEAPAETPAEAVEEQQKSKISEGSDGTKEEVIKIPDEEKTNYLIKQLQKIP